MIVYHRTSAAAAIREGGLRDGEGTYMTGEWHRGVFVSAPWPLDSNEGAVGEDVLELDVPEALFVEYEWVQDIGYREALIPAALLNACPIRLVPEDELPDRWADID